jgi:hypothetical protein
VSSAADRLFRRETVRRTPECQSLSRHWHAQLSDENLEKYLRELDQYVDDAKAIKDVMTNTRA